MRDPEHAWSRRLGRISREPERVLKWAKWYVTKQSTAIGHELFFDQDHDVSSTALVLGSARSGTTWVAEVLAADSETRFIMEPFDDRCSQFRGGLPDATYLSPGAHNDRLEYFSDRVFSGHLRSKWTDQYNHARHPSRRVVKDVRTVSLLGWFAARYPSMPIIYLIRHPFATAWSMASLGWGTHGSLLGERTRLDALTNAEKNILLPQAFLAEVTRWCVEQERGLRHLDPTIHVAFYENVVSTPETAFSDMADYLGGRSGAWKGWTPDASLFDRPSKTSVRRDAPQAASQWVESWQGELPPEVITQAIEIVRSFGLDELYGTQPTPNLEPSDLWRRDTRQ